MPHSPLILFWIKGLLLSRHTPQIRASDGFLICVRESLLRAIQSGHRRFRRACEGDAARSMISGRYTSELKRLSAVIQWISRVFSRVDFQAGERQCVKRPAGFTADGRADRISSRFDRICSLFRAYLSVGKRQCVKHAYICGIGVSAIRKIPQNRRIFRLVAGVSRVSGVHTKKSISLQPRG